MGHCVKPHEEYGELVQKINEEKRGNLSSFIDPTEFDLVVKSARQLCQFYIEDGNTKSKRPSFGLRLGNNLRKCAVLAKGMAIRAKDEKKLAD